MTEWINEWMHRWNGWMKELKTEIINCMTKCINEWMDEQLLNIIYEWMWGMQDRMNEWMN